MQRRWEAYRGTCLFTYSSGSHRTISDIACYDPDEEEDNKHNDDITADIPNRTTFYAGREKVAPAIDISYKWASGGFLSSVEDLVRYGSAFLPGSDFMKPETMEMLFTNQKTNDGEAIPHGIGWVVEKFVKWQASLLSSRKYDRCTGHSRSST